MPADGGVYLVPMAGMQRGPSRLMHGRRQPVFNAEDLTRMSPQERCDLRQALAELDGLGLAGSVRSDRRRAIVLAAIITCCVVLAAWIGILAVTLPRYYRAGGWRGAWVGFDLALLVVFAVTGWAAWRRRQVLIICLVVLATLLCCDAWFDVVLDARTAGFLISLLSALLIELPLAALAAVAARRLLRMTGALLGQFQGAVGPVPPLRNIPLIGHAPAGRLRDLLAVPAHGPDRRPRGRSGGQSADGDASPPGRLRRR
jgi:hypothetical protein